MHMIYVALINTRFSIMLPAYELHLKVWNKIVNVNIENNFFLIIITYKLFLIFTEQYQIPIVFQAKF